MGIIRKSIQETTGNSDNVAQVFKQNVFFDALESTTTPFAFEVPLYTTIGGTKEYYGQNPNAIFTSLVKPFIRFNFLTNTSSFGPNMYIKHDVYRISWDVFSSIQKKFKNDSNESTTIERFNTETIEEFDEVTGKINKKTITRRNSEKESSIKAFKDSFKYDEQFLKERPIINSDYGSAPISRDELLEILKQQLINPIYSLTKPTTGITNVYDLVFDEYIKNIGNYKTRLFNDRDQYIIDTNFIFNIELTSGLTEFEILSSDGSIINQTYSSIISGITNSENKNIEQGEFTGLKFKGGEYFSYFEVPDKPIFEYPTPTGQINTFTPEIFWSNGENADSYIVQVSYNTGDTEFTGTTFSYPIPKLDKYKEIANSKLNNTSSEFSSNKTIRKFQLSLKTNKCLIYRVGNVKELINIFGIKQSVVTFSDTLGLCTQVEPIKTYVYTESDSPYVSDISGFLRPPSLDSESPIQGYILSGIVSDISSLTGATIQLIYPNSNFITTTTNSLNEFYFDELEMGVYNLNASYRGYQTNSMSINITGNTSVNFSLNLLWGNNYDSFGELGLDLFS